MIKYFKISGSTVNPFNISEDLEIKVGVVANNLGMAHDMAEKILNRFVINVYNDLFKQGYYDGLMLVFLKRNLEYEIQEISVDELKELWEAERDEKYY